MSEQNKHWHYMSRRHIKRVAVLALACSLWFLLLAALQALFAPARAGNPDEYPEANPAAVVESECEHNAVSVAVATVKDTGQLDADTVSEMINANALRMGINPLPALAFDTAARAKDKDAMKAALALMVSDCRANARRRNDSDD